MKPANKLDRHSRFALPEGLRRSGNWAKDQMEDEDIGPIIKFQKERVVRPDEEKMCSFSPTVRGYRSIQDSLTGVIKRRLEDDGGVVRSQGLVIGNHEELDVLCATVMNAIFANLNRVIKSGPFHLRGGSVTNIIFITPSICEILTHDGALSTSGVF